MSRVENYLADRWSWLVDEHFGYLLWMIPAMVLLTLLGYIDLYKWIFGVK